MKKILTFLFLLASFGLFANQFKLLEFRSLPADFHAERNSVEDMDMEYCAALKVECDKPVDLNLKQKVYKKESIGNGAYYFFVTHKEKQITFTAPNFDPLTVDVPQKGLERGVTYYVGLEIIPDVVVTFNITPPPDRVIINDKIINKSKLQIATGNYRIRIEKAGFIPVDEQITISMNNAYFNYTLAKEGQDRIVEKIVKEPAPQPVATINVQPNDFSLERFHIRYEVTSCEMYEDQFVIEMKITNLADDRDVTILDWGNNRTRVFDDEGNEYYPGKINFANKSGSGDVKSMLVNGIVTDASFVFKKINKQANSISKFDLGIWMEESDDFRMTFKNIPIEKK